MSLLEQVVDLLERSEISYCLIGAAAMAAHGVPRSTLDIDLLTTDRGSLETPMWDSLRGAGAVIKVKRGDREDPLAGVVRANSPGERAVDVIVGRFSWQTRIVERARPVPIQGLSIPIAEPADLLLLKLYAGGPQDRWDIQQLLSVQPEDEWEATVEDRIGALPVECADLWRQLRAL